MTTKKTAHSKTSKTAKVVHAYRGLTHHKVGDRVRLSNGTIAKIYRDVRGQIRLKFVKRH